MDETSPSTDRLAIILIGGDLVDARAVPPLPADAYVMAADSGIAQAPLLAINVDLVIGDMDSADPAAVRDAEAHGAEIEIHPRDKDATDLELAVVAAAERGYTRLVVVGGTGGRLDHVLGNVLLVAAGRFDDLAIEWWTGREHVLLARPGSPVRVSGRPGDALSLIPLGGRASGVTTEGLRWPLSGDELTADTTRGISNELTGERAGVTVDSGTLLVVHTDADYV